MKFLLQQNLNIGIVGFTMSFISALFIMYSIVRALVSKAMGRLADKYSFKVLAMVSYALLAVCLFIVMFAVPENAKLLVAIHYLFYAFAMAGVSSCTVNLLYEEILPEQRMCAYAVQQAFSGLIGFLVAVVVGVFVDHVHTLPGGQIGGWFAQQWLACLGGILCVVAVVHIACFMKNKDKQEKID